MLSSTTSGNSSNTVNHADDDPCSGAMASSNEVLTRQFLLLRQQHLQQEQDQLPPLLPLKVGVLGQRSALMTEQLRRDQEERAGDLPRQWVGPEAKDSKLRDLHKGEVGAGVCCPSASLSSQGLATQEEVVSVQPKR